jgi:hypothetical protein
LPREFQVPSHTDHQLESRELSLPASQFQILVHDQDIESGRRTPEGEHFW